MRPKPGWLQRQSRKIDVQGNALITLFCRYDGHADCRRVEACECACHGAKRRA